MYGPGKDPAVIDYMGLDDQSYQLDQVISEFHCLYGELKELEQTGFDGLSVSPSEVQEWIREAEECQKQILDRMDRIEAGRE